MIRTAVAILVLLALTSSAFAAPRRMLVLPLGGDADPAVRAKYSASVQRIARTSGATVTTGDVTFTDTATAIGCDPKAPKCAEDVRATLGVDELVYGTVTKDGTSVVVVVRRISKGKQPREVSTTLEASESPDRAEPELLPLFRATGGSEDVVLVNEEKDPKDPKEQKDEPGTRTPLRRSQVLGFAAAGGGVTMLLISFALWSSASGLEDSIEDHPVENSNDFVQLRELEDKASTRAWTGNALFVAGLAVGGLGAWLLYKDRKAQHTVVAPAPIPNGAALMLGGVF